MFAFALLALLALLAFPPRLASQRVDRRRKRNEVPPVRLVRQVQHLRPDHRVRSAGRVREHGLQEPDTLLADERGDEWDDVYSHVIFSVDMGKDARRL